MANRTPRSLETREAGERKKPWKRASMLPNPEDRPGLKFRWIRTATLGNADMTNVSQRFREGYSAVRAEDYPELQIMSDVDSRFKENIEVGGLLLCSIAEEKVLDRIEGQLEVAQHQSDAVDRNLMRESDPRMPILAPERSSRTSFGKS
jgi:hypothetical protein|tara:strand:+ start:6560 stop:7006 length:447 start_codon:yes stop_codon:yes gene_type:complete